MRSRAPEVKPFGKLSLPEENVETLSNGITLHTLSGGEQPVCRMSLYFEGGEAEIGNDTASRMMLSSLADGTQFTSTERVADILDFNGVRTGTGCHGHYSSLTFSMLNHRVLQVLPLIREMIASPLFPEERLSSARLRAKANIENEKHEVAAIADAAFSALIMGERHPFSHRMTAEEVDRLDRQTIGRLHRRMVFPRGMHVFLSGLLNASLTDCVRSFLETVPAIGEGLGYAGIPFSCAPAGTLRNIEAPDSFQSAIITGLPAISRSHPDYIPLRLTVMALGGYFGSRLMANIREEKGLTYGISSALIGSQEGSYVKIAAQCDKKFTDTVLAETGAEMRRLAAEPPRGEELMRLKLFASTSLAEILDTPMSTMGYYSTRLLVGTPQGYFDAQQQAIASLTSETIAAMALKYLDPDKLITAVAGV